ncbi:MAG: type II toxin-antitoxin system VapC family toxin [Candidatus Kapaibacterium sp.]
MLDSNIVVLYLKGSFSKTEMMLLDNIVDTNPIVSVITSMEVLGYPFTNPQEQIITEQFILGSKVIEVNQNIVDTTIDIRRNNKIKLPDAIIAATAIAFNLTLVTMNQKDFRSISNVTAVLPSML